MANAAGRSGKQRRWLHRDVAAAAGKGQPGMSTSDDDLEVEGNPCNDTGGCDPEFASDGKGDPKK